MSQSRQDKPLTPWQSFFTGSVAGATEVFVDHPLWTIKTRKQSKLPFTLSPQVLYRGIIPNAASMAPITALQMGLNSSFQTLFYNNGTPLTFLQQLGSAFVAGVGSAFVSCPTEMVMTYQGIRNTSFLQSANYLNAEAGWKSLYRGFGATAVREGSFTTFYLAVTPMLKTTVKSYIENDLSASVTAGIGAGIAATIASQSADVLKTIQQKAPIKEPINAWAGIKKIYSEDGVQGFFKGGLARGTRVMSAVTILGLVNEKIEAAFKRRNGDF